MKYFQKTDGIILLTVLGSALIFLLLNGYFLKGPQDEVFAEIYYDNKLVWRKELSSAVEGKFSVPGKPDVVFQIFADKSIAFVQSDCPDKVCIHMGKLIKANQFAACLPNKMILKVVSGKKENKSPDLIVR